MVVDPEKGILKVAWLESDKDGSPEMKTMDVEIRESDEWLFANTKDDDKSNEYLWGRIKNEHGQILVWAPDIAAFRRLVEGGVLPGKVARSSVVLENLKPEHLKILTSGERGILYRWDEPVVLRKMGR